MIALALLLAGAAPAADGPAGRWLTPDGKAVIRVAPCGPALCGRIDAVREHAPGTPTTDVHNADPQRRRQPLIGLPVMDAMRRDGDGWTGGRVYDPKSGSSYRGSLAMEGPDTLKVTGCVLFLCRSQRWTRLK